MATHEGASRPFADRNRRGQERRSADPPATAAARHSAGRSRADPGSLAVLLCFVWIVFDQLTLLSGWLGFLVCWLFAVPRLLLGVNAMVNGRRVAADRVVGAVVTVGALWHVHAVGPASSSSFSSREQGSCSTGCARS